MADLHRPAWAWALRQLRGSRLMSQEEFAEAVGVQPRTVSRWEQGWNRPQPQQVVRICRAFDVAPEALCLLPSEGVRRRDFNLSLAGLAVAATGLDLERLADVLSHPDHLDQCSIDDLVMLTQLYTRQAQSIAPAVLLGPVVDLMRRIRWLLTGSHPDGVRRRLQTLYAENATVAGRLAFWADDRGRADDLLRLAFEQADAVGEPQLQAVILAFRADLHSTVPYIGTVPNNTNLAMSLFDDAAGLLRTDTPPLLRSWVYGCRAEEWAVLRRPLESDRDMERAHTALAAAHPGAGPDQVIDIAVLDIAAAAAGLSGFEGACAIALGRAREAREAFELGLREQSSIGRLSGLAAAYALEGDVESAADLLTRGLDEAIARKLPTRRRRVEGVRAAFLSRAADHPAVQRFDERLREVAR